MNNKIAEKIKTPGKNSGLSQEALAEKACISTYILQRIENGQAHPGLKKKPAFIRGFRFILLLIFISWNLVTVAQTETPAKPYPPPGQLIDIGGWKLHITGDAKVNQGPAVVLEAGAGDFSFDWSLVQREVENFARVYSYDRAGSAWSQLGPGPHTMQQAVYELHTLLQKANIPPPYILVGASYGGLLVRLFADKYPGEVAGMVLVDAGYEDGISFINGKMLRPSKNAKGEPIPPVRTSASDTDNKLAQTPEAKKIIGDALSKAGMPRTYLDAPYNKLPDSVQKIRLWAVTQFEYYAATDNDYMMEEKALMIRNRKLNAQPLEKRPLIVLTRGRTDKPAADSGEIERKRIQAGFTELSANSKQIIADGSGHHIQLERPDLVVKAIREVMDAVLNNKTVR
ncbi:alpha/beta fold hydrolase [Flavitalea sp.]|nr:alpha/beta fold hydrolase [Flavitalea sp.]